MPPPLLAAPPARPSASSLAPPPPRAGAAAALGIRRRWAQGAATARVGGGRDDIGEASEVEARRGARQRQRRLRVPARQRQRQRREAQHVAREGVAARGEQRRDRLAVPAPCGVHQRRPAVEIHMLLPRARGQQRAHRARVAAARRDEQRREPLVVRLVHCAPRLHQHRRRVRVPARRRHVQRPRALVVVPLRELRATELQQQKHTLHVPPVHSDVQRRPPLPAAGRRISLAGCSAVRSGGAHGAGARLSRASRSIPSRFTRTAAVSMSPVSIAACKTAASARAWSAWPAPERARLTAPG